MLTHGHEHKKEINGAFHETLATPVVRKVQRHIPSILGASLGVQVLGFRVGP